MQVKSTFPQNKRVKDIQVGSQFYGYLADIEDLDNGLVHVYGRSSQDFILSQSKYDLKEQQNILDFKTGDVFGIKLMTADDIIYRAIKMPYDSDEKMKIVLIDFGKSLEIQLNNCIWMFFDLPKVIAKVPANSILCRIDKIKSCNISVQEFISSQLGMLFKFEVVKLERTNLLMHDEIVHVSLINDSSLASSVPAIDQKANESLPEEEFDMKMVVVNRQDAKDLPKRRVESLEAPVDKKAEEIKKLDPKPAPVAEKDAKEKPKGEKETPPAPKIDQKPKDPDLDMVGKPIFFYVTDCNDVNDHCGLFAHLPGTIEKGKYALTEEILEDYQANKLEKLEKCPAVGDVVLAHCKADGLYYRAKIIKIDENVCKTFFVDFGIIKLVDRQKLMKLPKKYENFPFQAFRFRIGNIDCSQQTKIERAKTLKFLIEKCRSKFMQGIVLKKNKEKITLLLHDFDGFDVGQMLVESKLVTKVDV